MTFSSFRFCAMPTAAIALSICSFSKVVSPKNVNIASATRSVDEVRLRSLHSRDKRHAVRCTASSSGSQSLTRHCLSSGIVPMLAFFARLFSSVLLFLQSLFVVIDAHSYPCVFFTLYILENLIPLFLKVESLFRLRLQLFTLTVYGRALRALFPRAPSLGPLQAGLAPRRRCVAGGRHLLGSRTLATKMRQAKSSTYPFVPRYLL